MRTTRANTMLVVTTADVWASRASRAARPRDLLRSSNQDTLPPATRSSLVVVVATHAGADAVHIGAVDVDGDRGRAADVADPVDVSRRREPADLAGMIGALTYSREVRIKQLLVLDALNDAEDAPGQVVVDARDLAGPPNESDDGERTVWLDVQRVALKALRIAAALLGREHLGAWQVPSERVSDELSGSGPVELNAH